jgi:hypothetical protein
VVPQEVTNNTKKKAENIDEDVPYMSKILA